MGTGYRDTGIAGEVRYLGTNVWCQPKHNLENTVGESLAARAGIRKEISVSIDWVQKPPHYKIKGDMDVIDVIEALAKDDAWYANAIKYLLRAKKKGKLTEDLGKCKFYIDRMLRDAESETK